MTLKRLGRLGIMLLAMLAAARVSPALAQEPSLDITVERIAGKVEVRHEELTKDAWRQAAKGEQIGEHWSLRTGEDSKVQLLFNATGDAETGNIVILKENSVLTVDKLFTDGTGRLKVDSGGILVDIKQALSPGSQFEVETPTALAVVRGTKYGIADIDEYSATFFGYIHTVDVFQVDSFGSVVGEAFPLGEGTQIDTEYQKFDGPKPAGDAAELFLAEMEDTSAFDAYDDAIAGFADRLQPFVTRAHDINQQLSDYAKEWHRYERNDQRFQMLYLYVQVLYVWQDLDELGYDYASFLDDADPDGLLFAGLFRDKRFSGFSKSDDPGDGYDYYDDQLEFLNEILSPEWREGFGGGMRLLATDNRSSYELLEEFMRDADPFIDGNQDLIDKLQGLIEPSGNPALALRWKLFDTDNDGISDVDETMLGLDPFDSNRDGFITLLNPDDGEQLDYPDDTEVRFSFEELDTDFIEQYDLVLTSSRGRQWVARDVDENTDVELEFLFGPGGIFRDDIETVGTEQTLELTWRIVAKVDEDELFAGIAAANPDFGSAFGGTIASETRELSISSQIEQNIILDLEGVGRTDVSYDGQLFTPDIVRIRGVISEVSDLRQWSITVLFDPTVLEFDRGRRSGLFGSSTVFFSEDSSGVIKISGQLPASAPGIAGEGEIFVLEFRPVDLGFTTVELEDVEMQDSFGNAIEVENGDDVDVSVDSVAGAASVDNIRRGGKR